MPRFVLQPCRVREDRIVPRGEPVEWTLRELLDNITRDPADRRHLRSVVSPGVFVGVCKKSKPPSEAHFSLVSPDRTNNIEWLLRKDPSFADRVLSVYRVVEADWGTSFEEVDTLAKRPQEGSAP